MVFVEAAACGAAIVTSDIAPMNEYLSDGRSALLVREFLSPSALAAAIEVACQEGDLRRMIKAGAQQIVTPFGQREVDQQEVALYREVLELAPVKADIPYRWMRAVWRFRSTACGDFCSRALRKLQKLSRHIKARSVPPLG